MTCIGFVFNIETYIILKDSLPNNTNIGKSNLESLAEFYSGVPIFKKVEQKENCYAFTNQELLNKYLKGDYDEEYLQLLLMRKPNGLQTRNRQ